MKLTHLYESNQDVINMYVVVIDGETFVDILWNTSDTPDTYGSFHYGSFDKSQFNMKVRPAPLIVLPKDRFIQMKKTQQAIIITELVKRAVRAPFVVGWIDSDNVNVVENTYTVDPNDDDAWIAAEILTITRGVYVDGMIDNMLATMGKYSYN